MSIPKVAPSTSVKRVPLRSGPRTPNRRLRELRRNRGWSYEVLGGEAGGLSRKTVREIEEGITRNPRISTMYALAQALDVEVTDLDPKNSAGSRA